MALKRWLQEPLLHFLLIGAALFALFYQVADPEAVSDNRIVISEQDIDRMINLFERRLQRLPTELELNGLVEGHIREEVLYREALAMGLDQDDTIVRRRMAQKVEFMFNDLVDAAEPTDEELQQYLDGNPDKFIESARTSFTHVYLSADERGDKVMTDAQQLLVALNSKQDPIDPDTAGDPFMFGYTFDNQSNHQISRIFGSDFAASLASLAAGSWQGPVASGYGRHLVYINDRTESWLPPLADIRDPVLYEVLAERRQQANSAFYKTLLERYEVIVEQPLTQQSLVEMELTQ
jgi:peptidyl-prolyl cis-trans isomerase C